MNKVKPLALGHMEMGQCAWEPAQVHRHSVFERGVCCSHSGTQDCAAAGLGSGPQLAGLAGPLQACAMRKGAASEARNPERWINISATSPGWYLRSRARLNLGLSPWPSGLNRKCIKGLYLETHMAVFREQPQFFRLLGSTMPIGVLVLSLGFIIY